MVLQALLQDERGTLPKPVTGFATACTALAVVVSAMSIHLQLKNYHKPALQRMVVRIMLMVPIYAISSLISLFSLEAAFVIDAIRDVYEAFVIYCFFHLLLCYLGGERSLLILLHGRPPKIPVFPVNLFVRELDVSDPHTFLFLKRGILQYVQVKPVLAFATLILKAIGKFDEGDFGADSGYLYVSIVYNISIFLALYCLAMFWMCVHEDLKPFRPVPKFLCVKGILFFSFWQSLFVSILVAARIISSLGPYTSPSEISLGITDLLICAEMPLFAFFHLYAFSYKDYLSPHLAYVGRMPMWYAFRDAFGLKDVVEEAKATLRGEGMDYRQFEPTEGQIHQGIARERRIRAGLRYSKGGARKYWLPRAVHNVREGRDDAEASSPLVDPDEGAQGYGLPFGDISDERLAPDEALYAHARRYFFGDYHYPCIDVSSERARHAVWAEEERVLRDELAAGGREYGYGAVGEHPVRVRMNEGREAVVDHEQGEDGSAGDVKLAWTRAGARPGTRTGTRVSRGTVREDAADPVDGLIGALAKPPEVREYDHRGGAFAPPHDENPWA